MQTLAPNECIYYELTPKEFRLAWYLIYFRIETRLDKPELNLPRNVTGLGPPGSTKLSSQEISNIDKLIEGEL